MLTYGDYGGRFVPGDRDPGSRRARARLAGGAGRRRLQRRARTRCCRSFGGRPTPLTLASRFAPGKRLYLKREDLLHTGAHKLNNALGQALLARRLGKTRIVAETGAGQHGVAVATVCARFGLECVVYMGEEDVRRQSPNVQRMRLLGAEVRPVDLRDGHAARGDERGDSRLDRRGRDDALPDRLLRRSAPLPGDRARSSRQ